MVQEAGPSGDRDRTLATVRRLVLAADGDTLYRDVYFRRAAELLAPIVSEMQWDATRTNREQLDTLLAQAHGALTRQDWAQLRELGKRAGALQRALEADGPLTEAAEAVYTAPLVVLDPLSPGLRSASERWSGAAQARAEVSAALAELARDDAAARDLYAARQKALDALVLPELTPAESRGSAPTASVEQHALQALEHGDAAALERLAESMLARESGTRPQAEPGVPAARAALSVPDVLGQPLAERHLSRARALGLEQVETTFAAPQLGAAITEFVVRYAPAASASTFNRARDGVTRIGLAAREVGVPPEVAAVFAETISHLALHLYVNSAGIRYVPLPSPREVLLVECHPEGEEPVTPLLRELGLRQRRGLARDDVEAALQRHGARIVADHLGLDPLAFRLVCIPQDLFVRIGRDRTWGAREEWTHFDGYQVMSGGRLRALVGGNARFGGLFDLCSIARDDARENTLLRLAVIRRERLGVRLG